MINQLPVLTEWNWLHDSPFPRWDEEGGRRVILTNNAGLEGTAGHMGLAGVLDGDEIVAWGAGGVRELIPLFHLTAVQLYLGRAIDGDRQCP